MMFSVQPINNLSVLLENKRCISLIAVLFFLPTPSFAQQKLQKDQLQLSPGTDIYYWKSSDGREGMQTFTPVGASFSTTVKNAFDVDIAVKSSLIYSENLSSDQRGSVSTVSDTVLSGTVSYLRRRSFQPFITVSLNIPTGKATLSGTQKNAMMDHDLVGQIRFGEGRNTLAGGGVSIAAGKRTIITPSFSYNIRGKYTPDGDTNNDFDPGDQKTLSLGTSYFRKNFTVHTNATYVMEDKSTLNTVDFYDPGDRLSFSIDGGVRIGTHIVSGFLGYTTFAKNEFFNYIDDAISKETSNSNPNIWQVGLDSHHTYRPHTKLGISTSALIRTENEYDAASDFYIPERQLYKVGPTITYQKDNASIRAKSSFIHMRDAESAFTSKQSYEGVHLSVNANIIF